MDSRVLVRRTRQTEYYRQFDGKIVSADFNAEVTKNSFVNRRPIKYKKRSSKKTTKSPSKQSKPTTQKRTHCQIRINVSSLPIPVHLRASRVQIDRPDERAVKVYPTIDLNITTVPKPTKGGELKK